MAGGARQLGVAVCENRSDEIVDVDVRARIDADRGFDLTTATVRCCDREFAPDQLKYVPEQGFAMVSFEITDPSKADHETPAAQLASMLDVPMRTIIARY